MPPEAVWALVGLLMALGLVGAVLPVLPSGPLILAGAVLLKVFLPQYLSWWAIGALAALATLSAVLDVVLPAVGGRRLGAGRWGILGAGIGAFLGIFGGPLAILCGAFLGGALGEFFLAKKAPEAAAKAGLGAALGLLASTAGKLVVALLMIALFLADCFLL